MQPTPAQIVDVLSARHTAFPGFIDLEVVVTGHPGESGPVTVPYTWHVDEEYDNSWNVAAWFADHPDFEIAPYVAPPVIVPPVTPQLFAAVAVCITDGAIATIELAAQLSSAAYEDGWAMIGFSEPQDTAEYLIFAQTDVLAKIEQFKEPGYFELVISDPVSGDPLNPGRIDIQILKVR